MSEWKLTPDDLSGLPFRYLEKEDRFQICIPDFANIASDTVGRQATGVRAKKPAVIFEDDSGLHSITYAQLDHRATRVAAWLQTKGVNRGDVVAIHSLQRPETIIAHLATYKVGAIAATVSQLTGVDTMYHIMTDSGAKVIFTNSKNWERFRKSRSSFPMLERVVCAENPECDEFDFSEIEKTSNACFRSTITRSEDPALLIYTSGSTGQPKGILHGHRILHALNATIELFYNLELRAGEVTMWAPADWAWVGGFNDVVLPSLTFGHTLIVTEHRYDPEWALRFMGKHGVTHTLLLPTSLKQLAKENKAQQRFGLKLQTIFTGGESLPGETHRQLTENLGTVCNEGYGTTEVNQMIGNCQKIRPIRPGSMGWEFPGHRVKLVDESGVDVAIGESGEIVVAATDPTACLEYWKRPDLTDKLYLGGGWIRTHDLAIRDEDGYFWYQGRNDDLIKSSGFRIGPAEIEDTMLSHPLVSDVGVVGIPDDNRGAVVKAFVVLSSELSDKQDACKQLIAHVKNTLGPHKQPREVEFVESLPRTRTGKISRASLREIHKKLKK
jgi:acetyl-CoA synthetase